jgi:hypothetical protein
MTGDCTLFVGGYRPLEEPDRVEIADGPYLEGIGLGTIKLTLKGLPQREITVSDVLYVPKLATNLMSVIQLEDRGITIATSGSGSMNLLRNGKVIGRAPRIGRSYILDTVDRPMLALSAKPAPKSAIDWVLWHRRFGHIGREKLLDLHKAVEGIDEPLIEVPLRVCEPCIFSKQLRIVNRVAPKRATVPLRRIYSDVWGPYSVPTLGGAVYFLSFVCDYTRHSTIYLMVRRKEVRKYFYQYKEYAERCTGFKIMAIRTDNAKEYVALGKELADIGITVEFTVYYTPEQNGVAERLNRTLITIAKALLFDARLPPKFWGEAANTANYLRNRLPIGPDSKTPQEAFTRERPSVSHLRVFGCLAYAYQAKETRLKLDPNSIKTIFVGYEATTRQYRVYDPVNDKLIRSSNVMFFENERLRFNWPDGDQFSGELDEPFDPFEAPEEPLAPQVEVDPLPEQPNIEVREPEPERAPLVESPQESDEERSTQEEPEDLGVRRSSRIRKPTQPFEYARSAITRPKEPRTYQDAITDPIYGTQWKAAVQDELDKLQGMSAWKVVDRPPSRKIVGSKWVFKVKYTPSGQIDKFKARLVAQGFTQVHGVDYNEVYSPTLKLDSLRTILAIAAMEDLEVHQLDVVNAYINGQLRETIYMEPPRCLGLRLNQVLLLGVPMYGLKQSGKAWYDDIYSKLRKLGFTRTESDWSVFVSTDGSIIIGLYVDDMVIAGRSIDAIKALKQALTKEYPLKDMGEITGCLGIRITRNRALRTIQLDQEAYFSTVLSNYGLENCTPVATPCDGYTSISPATADEERADQQLYSSMVGSVMWGAVATRFDVAWITNRLTQFCVDPTIRHQNAVIRILRYVAGTLQFAIVLGGLQGPDRNLVGYTDADYGGILDRHSVSASLFLLGGGPVSWSSKRQRVVVTSTVESEYIALCTGAKTGVWIRRLLYELNYGHYTSETGTIRMLGDNQGSLSLANNPENHQRTKHIDIQYHYTRELVETGAITIEYCPTKLMLADILTKPLRKAVFLSILRRILRQRDEKDD